MKIEYTLSELDEVAARIVAETSQKIILFYGEMGTGKTTLITAICKQLGVTTGISSPTYAIVNEYDATHGLVYHFDFYRIKAEEEAYAIGFEEYLQQDAWVFIEWPSKIVNLIPEIHSTVTLTRITDQKRELILW